MLLLSEVRIERINQSNTKSKIIYSHRNIIMFKATSLGVIRISPVKKLNSHFFKLFLQKKYTNFNICKTLTKNIFCMYTIDRSKHTTILSFR